MGKDNVGISKGNIGIRRNLNGDVIQYGTYQINLEIGNAGNDTGGQSILSSEHNFRIPAECVQYTNCAGCGSGSLHKNIVITIDIQA